jgi:hypothetical protein
MHPVGASVGGISMLKLKVGLQSTVDCDGAVILDGETGVISTLNPTGAYVWSQVSEGRSLDEIVAGLSAETGEAPPTIEPDVLRFIDELHQEGLLRQ